MRRSSGGPRLFGKFPVAGVHDYAAHTVQWLGQRLVSLVVGGFALMGFCLVPLGEHTALGHLAALWRTDAARGFAQGLVTGARAVVAELDAATGEKTEPSSQPVEPRRRAPAAPRRTAPANASLVAPEAEPLLCLWPPGPAALPPVPGATAAPLVVAAPAAAASALRPDG